MNFLELIKSLVVKPRIPAFGGPSGIVPQHTNPERNRQRKLKRELGARQYRRQTRVAYERRATGLASHQVIG